MTESQASNHSVRRINYLADSLASETYLEVGVYKGVTFLDIKINSKTAVDPRFRFDFGRFQSASISFFEVESDQYFAEHAGKDKFDIIFLDGLHTFEQTLRDFCNTLLHCHEKTIWVIDDTYPNDVYSTIKEQRKAIHARKDAGGHGWAWHGDVYKIVFAIHDFFPCLSYCTISSNGNPQTLVWNKPRENFQPIFNDLEIVSRLTYFDLKENSSALRLMPEEEALRSAVVALRMG